MGTTTLVFARHELVHARRDPHAPALLLEGSWPPEHRHRRLHPSLDDAVDCRLAWIDEEAARLAERLAAAHARDDRQADLFHRITPAYLNALPLRYYLVKLLRVVAYFSQIRPLSGGDRLELTAGAGRDEDYALLVAELCRLAGARCHVQWIGGKKGDRSNLPERPEGCFAQIGPVPFFPANGWWRRWTGRLCRTFEPPVDGFAPHRRVVICGNPRLLDPVCRELLKRGCRTWWLYDRFALKAWLRRRPGGVGQLVCDSSLGRENRLLRRMPESLRSRGVDLARPVERWLADRVDAHGPRQTRIVEQIDAHFHRVRPHTLILDEDATALARAAVAVGRRYGAESLVVQHGAPLCRFGFAPPAADRVLLWGAASQRQLIQWGVPPERTAITGSPWHEDLRREFRKSALLHKPTRRPRILLLMTTPPRDDRPDSVQIHLTTGTHAEMLRMAFAVVAGIADARLVVKLHPRAPRDPFLDKTLADFPSVRCRLVRRGPLEKWLADCDCVLSCISSAGVDAILAGVPVIQLAPPGSGNILPHDQWGLLGTARSETQLQSLLRRALQGYGLPATRSDAEVFSPDDRPAAARIADAIGKVERRTEGNEGNEGKVREESVGSGQSKSSTVRASYFDVPCSTFDIR